MSIKKVLSIFSAGIITVSVLLEPISFGINMKTAFSAETDTTEALKNALEQQMQKQGEYVDPNPLYALYDMNSDGIDELFISYRNLENIGSDMYVYSNGSYVFEHNFYTGAKICPSENLFMEKVYGGGEMTKIYVLTEYGLLQKDELKRLYPDFYHNGYSVKESEYEKVLSQYENKNWIRVPENSRPVSDFLSELNNLDPYKAEKEKILKSVDNEYYSGKDSHLENAPSDMVFYDIDDELEKVQLTNYTIYDSPSNDGNEIYSYMGTNTLRIVGENNDWYYLVEYVGTGRFTHPQYGFISKALVNPITTTTTTSKTTTTSTTTTTTTNTTTTTKVTAGAVAGFSYPLNGLDPKNSPVKPTISVDCVEISIDEAKQNPVQNVGVTIEGADKKYCSTGFHILFDDRLTIENNPFGDPNVKRGEAVSNLSAFLSRLQAKNALFVCASGSGDYGLNGTYCKIPFRIPADCKEGDVYPINIAYLGNDLFTNSNNDVSGKLMQAWVFTHGIKQGYIRIKGDTEKPIPSISIPDVYTKSTATIPAYQPSNVKGDANNDGVFNIADLVMTQRWLLGNGRLTAWENADVCKDNRIDVFDMVILRRMMIEKIPATDKEIISTYAEVETVPDYYTNDGTDWHGDSLPFSASQIKSIKIIDVYDNGTKVARSNIDEKLINFGGLTPANIYSSSNKYFEYNVQIYYGDLPLRDKNGSPVCIKAYIGLKGDISLDNKLDSIDASDILRIYSSYAMGVSVNIFTSNPIVTNSQDPLNELARYLADVDRDGIIDATDASDILRTYSQAIGK